MYFDAWNYNSNNNRFKTSHHCCSAGSSAAGSVDYRREALIRKLKQLAAKLKRLMEQLSMAKTPTEKNSLQIRIEQVQSEIALVERDLNT